LKPDGRTLGREFHAERLRKQRGRVVLLIEAGWQDTALLNISPLLCVSAPLLLCVK
jgi:hypothetical protein